MWIMWLLIWGFFTIVALVISKNAESDAIVIAIISLSIAVVFTGNRIAEAIEDKT